MFFIYHDDHAVLVLLLYTLYAFGASGHSALGGWESANAFIQRLTLVNTILIVETLASFSTKQFLQV
jgi:hypothetical protein